MIPNQNFFRFFPETETPEQKQSADRSGCLKIGAYLVLKKIISAEGTRLPHRKEKSQTLDERDGHRSDLSKAQSFKMPSEGGRRTLSSPEHGDRPSQRGVVDRHHLYPDEARLPVSYSHHRLVQQMYRRMVA